MAKRLNSRRRAEPKSLRNSSWIELFVFATADVVVSSACGLARIVVGVEGREEMVVGRVGGGMMMLMMVIMMMNMKIKMRMIMMIRVVMMMMMIMIRVVNS